MTDLLHVLPDFDTTPYAPIFAPLERALITINDILTVDAIDIAKRASVPLDSIGRLKDELCGRLQHDIEELASEDVARQSRWRVISTLDEGLDAHLGGGIAAGYLSEVTGESAAGKTQLLLSLCLSVQLPPPYGFAKSALYITTEGPLQTTRLAQIIKDNLLISSVPKEQWPSLAHVHSIKVSDIESQDHILTYQVPVAVDRLNVGLIVVDSIAANFRAEFDKGPDTMTPGKGKRAAFAVRNEQLISLGAHLRHLAAEKNIVVVVANQVLDRFSPQSSAFEQAPSQASSRSASQAFPSRTPSSIRQVPNGNGNDGVDQVEESKLSTPDPLSLEHQQRFVSGWGALPSQARFDAEWLHVNYHRNNQKTPSLGQVWTSQLGARIVLLKSPVYKDYDYKLGSSEKEIAHWRRQMHVVFAPWASDDNGSLGIEFEVWEGGTRATTDDRQKTEDAG